MKQGQPPQLLLSPSHAQAAWPQFDRPRSAFGHTTSSAVRHLWLEPDHTAALVTPGKLAVMSRRY